MVRRIGRGLLFVGLVLVAFVALRSLRTVAQPPNIPDSALIAAGDSFGLAAALQHANQRGPNAAPYRIYLLPGEYPLHPPGEITRPNLPPITGNVIVEGGGATLRFMHTGTASATLEIRPGANVTLRHLTLTGGSGSARTLRNAGNLTLTDTTLSDGPPTPNRPDSNPGLSGVENAGILRVERVHFARNQTLSSTQPGGALANSGEAEIVCSRFTDNRAARGGAIFNTGTLTVYRSAFSGNTANGGGAIFSESGRVEAADNWWGGRPPRLEDRLLGTDTVSSGVNVPTLLTADPQSDPACAPQAPAVPPFMLAAQTSNALFTDPGVVLAPAAAPPGSPEARRVRYTGINLGLVAAPPPMTGSGAATLTLNAFEDAIYTAAFDQITADGNGGLTWAGRLIGYPASEAVISTVGGVVWGHISTGTRAFTVQYTGSGNLYVLAERTLDALPACAGSRRPLPSTPLPSIPTPRVGPAAPPPDFTTASGPTIIDVLVLYTLNAATGGGGHNGTLAAINGAVALANQSYINSGVDQRIRLVYAGPTNYADANYDPPNGDEGIFTDLYRLTTTDGYMDEVFGLRLKYRADVVILLGGSANVGCGVAWQGPDRNNAYGVVAIQCISNHSFAHELGHTMGSDHDIANAFGGAYPYSYGWRDPAGEFRTIMAYRSGCSGVCTRINYWSHSSQTYNSKPLGDANADNARSLNNTRNIVAGFYTAPLTDTLGVWRPSSQVFHLSTSLAGGMPTQSIHYGQAGDVPLVGDWDGDGIRTLGVWRNGLVYLKDSNAPSAPVTAVFAFGLPGDIPLVGDWDGDGRESLGVFRPSAARFYLRNALSTGPHDFNVLFGLTGDLPIVGDWDGDGIDTPGVFRPTARRFYLTNQMCGCRATTHIAFAYGLSMDMPVSGDWNADGRDSVGVFRPAAGMFYLRNALSSGPIEISVRYGLNGDRPLTGRFIAP